MKFLKLWPARLGKGLLAVIFLPLFAALFFGMPLELAVSSWHLATTRETTTGVVISSEVLRFTGRGEGTLSKISYQYVVHGKTYQGSRVSSGWSHEAYSRGGGELARSLKAGDPILVHYSAGDPKFAFLEYGWPGYAVGFSLLIAGMVATGMFAWMEPGSRRVFWLHALIRGLPFSGLGVMGVGDRVIVPAAWWEVGAIYCVSVLGVAMYLKIKYRKRPSYAADFQRAPRRK